MGGGWLTGFLDVSKLFLFFFSPIRLHGRHTHGLLWGTNDLTDIPEVVLDKELILKHTRFIGNLAFPMDAELHCWKMFKLFNSFISPTHEDHWKIRLKNLPG